MSSIAIHVQAAFATAVEISPRVGQVAAMFGLGVDETKTITLIPPTDLSLAPHQILFITGASGGGKTTLLRQIAEALKRHSHLRVIDFASLGQAPDLPLVEALPGELHDTVRRLALAGLNDAFVMLRKFSQLSDGQRHRFQLARAIAQAEQQSKDQGPKSNVGFTVVLADEFAASLDRLTAQVIARNIRKWSRKAPVCFIAATTHDDLLESLDPDTLIIQHPGRAMEILTRGSRTET